VWTLGPCEIPKIARGMETAYPISIQGNLVELHIIAKIFSPCTTAVIVYFLTSYPTASYDFLYTGPHNQIGVRSPG
jgi:hypothetical protein